MTRFMMILIAIALLYLPMTAAAGEGPMKLPAGSNSSADMHNDEGIKHFQLGHFDVALEHFQEASKADSTIGETHFNEAVTLDKLGRHGEATMHFKAAKKYANGKKSIVGSPILNAHIGH